MKKMGSACNTNAARRDFKTARMAKNQAGKTYEIFQVKKGGGLYQKPSRDLNGYTRFTLDEAAALKTRWEELNPGSKWELVNAGN
jgi:hypothetical protein